MRRILLRLRWICGGLAVTAAAASGSELPTAVDPSPAAVSLRREYNEVAAAIDTIVRVYSVDRFQRITEADPASIVKLPPGSRLVLLFWADDEAMLYLNGSPLGETRLTPTRIEIPTLYLQHDNELTARCWDTDRVESGFMAGLYVEDDAGLRPVLTTAERWGWTAADGEPAQEIYYAHAQPDLPGAEVMWGAQLFGQVQLQARFTAADVIRAARRAPMASMSTQTRERTMDFHRVLSRLVGLQQRREELATRLSARVARSDTDIRFRGGAALGLSFSLGSAAPLAELDDEKTTSRLKRWVRTLAPEQIDLVLHEARRLRGAEAATAPAPLEPETGARGDADRRADYRPPEDRGTAGEGRGTSTPAGGPGGVLVAPSTAFLVRMSLLGLLLALWTSMTGWRGWRLWNAVSWKGGNG